MSTFGQLIRQLQGAVGGKSFRSGTAVLSFTASTNSAVVGVQHDLGAVPRVVVASSFGAPAFGKIPNCDTFSVTDSAFSLTGELKVAHTGDITVAWIAST